VNRSSYRYWLANPIKMVPERIRLIAEMKRWFALSNGSAVQRSLVTLLATSGFNVSRWLVNKLMKQEGLVSRQMPTQKYAKGEKSIYQYPMCLTATLVELKSPW